MMARSTLRSLTNGPHSNSDNTERAPGLREGIALFALLEMTLTIPPTVATVRMNRLTFVEGMTLLGDFALVMAVVSAAAILGAIVLARVIARPSARIAWWWAGVITPAVAFYTLLLYRTFLKMRPLSLEQPVESLQASQWVLAVQLGMMALAALGLIVGSSLLVRRLWVRRPAAVSKRTFGASGALLLFALVALAFTHFGWRPQDVLTPADGSGLQPASTRVFIVGVDGADWRVINALRAQGELPNLDALVARGAHAPLETFIPTFSPNIWTSYFTGQTPEAHNIRDFITFRLPGFERDIYMPQSWTAGLLRLGTLGLLTRNPISSRYRTARPLWDIARDASIPTLHVGTMGTWPVDPVYGVMITDRLLESVEAYSSSGDGERFSKDLRSITTEPGGVGEIVEGLMAKGVPNSDDALHTELFFRFLEDVDPQLAILYLPDIDRQSHSHFCCEDVCLPKMLACHEPVLDAYRGVDGVLGRLQEATGPQDIIILVSDHGFGLYRRDFGIFRSHVGLDGIFVMAGGPIRPGPVEPMQVLDLMPTLLYLLGLPRAADMPGKVRVDYLKPNFVAAHPVRERPTYELAPYSLIPIQETQPLDDEQIEKLRALGYIE